MYRFQANVGRCFEGKAQGLCSGGDTDCCSAQVQWHSMVVVVMMMMTTMIRRPKRAQTTRTNDDDHMISASGQCCPFGIKMWPKFAFERQVSGGRGASIEMGRRFGTFADQAGRQQVAIVIMVATTTTANCLSLCAKWSPNIGGCRILGLQSWLML